MIGVILAAAGSGTRLGTAVPKQFLELEGIPVYQHCLDTLVQFADEMVLVVPQDWRERVQNQLGRLPLRVMPTVVAGGTSRQDSVWLGLGNLSPLVDLVLVHDAARPFLSRELVASVIEGTQARGACVPGLPPTETVKCVTDQNLVETTLERSSLRLIQTPQGFCRQLLETALRKAAKDRFRATDEAMLVERLGQPVLVIPGDPGNIKITLPGDLKNRPVARESRGRA